MKIPSANGALVLILCVFSLLASANVTDFVGKNKEIEMFLKKSEGWPSKDLSKKEIHLNDNQKKPILAVSSKSECGTRTCTTYLFEPSEKERYRLIGKIDGIMELLPDSHHEHFDIKATSSIGGGPEESVEVVYQFNGKTYQVVEGGK